MVSVIGGGISGAPKREATSGERDPVDRLSSGVRVDCPEGSNSRWTHKSCFGGGDVGWKLGAPLGKVTKGVSGSLGVVARDFSVVTDSVFR